MVARKNEELSEHSETPITVKGLIDLARVLARHAAREVVASSLPTPVHEEQFDE